MSLRSCLSRTLVRLPAALLGAALATTLVVAPSTRDGATDGAAAAGAPGGGVTAPALAPVADAQPTWPIRAAFYYGWGQSRYRATPLHGSNDTLSPDVARRHVRTMRYMGMAAGISSWWGAGSPSDRRFPNQLRAADGTPFRWTLYYELEGPQYADPSVAKIRADLAYLKQRYAGDRNYLRVGGKPVLFVWADPSDGCGMAARWKAANTLGFHIVLKRFYRNDRCLGQTASWHDYAPGHRTVDNLPWSVSVSPGFHYVGEAKPRLVRSPGAWHHALKKMKASKAKWQLVTTFNEWGEGTAVDAAVDWRSWTGHGRYADLSHATFGSR